MMVGGSPGAFQRAGGSGVRVDQICECIGQSNGMANLRKIYLHNVPFGWKKWTGSGCDDSSNQDTVSSKPKTNYEIIGAEALLKGAACSLGLRSDTCASCGKVLWFAKLPL